MDHGHHDPGPPSAGPQVDPAEYASHPHAFVMLGSEALFGCHMTSLWMMGHTYQIVLRLHVSYDVMQAYKAAISEPLTPEDAARYHAPRTCFLTCFPDPFPLPELLLGRRTFLGQLNRGFPKQFTGWPWGNEQALKDRIPVDLERVVYFRHFDYRMEYPEVQTYVLFGERDEAHLYHYQTKELDYDQMASLARAPAWLHPQRLRAGVHVSFPELRGGHTPCEDPFGARRNWRVQYQGTGPERDLDVAHTQWFSTLVTNSPGAPPCSDAASTQPPSSHGGTPADHGHTPGSHGGHH